MNTNEKEHVSKPMKYTALFTATLYDVSTYIRGLAKAKAFALDLLERKMPGAGACFVMLTFQWILGGARWPGG